MKQVKETKYGVPFRGGLIAQALLLGLLLGLGSGCGGKNDSPDADSSTTVSGGGSVVSPLVASVADGCGLETYVGPDRGYESPWVKNGVWHDSFEYSGGLGYEGTSGFMEHASASNGEIQRDPRCEKLKRAFLAAPVDDQNTSNRKYDLALSIDVTAPNFPWTSQEARATSSLPTQKKGVLVIRVIKPCVNNPYSCWQEDGLTESFPVELDCQSNPDLTRKSGAIADGLDQDKILDLYSMVFPDQCSFAVRHATISLADGSKIRASLSGTAAKEISGAFLRIKRIAIED